MFWDRIAREGYGIVDLPKPLCRKGVLEIGPIPKGTPINLFANIEPNLDNLLRLIPAVNAALAEDRGHLAG